ncbi:MAG: pyridoxamine 5'-phosphate oxidase family protein [Acidimicrobiia bacterium]
METTIDLETIEDATRRLGPVAYLATVTQAGDPHVSPVYPAFYESDIWVAVALDFVKVRNVRAHPRVNLHYQVLEANDMETLLIWGIATVRTGLGIRRALWNGVFDYDLNSFSPGGPETAEEIGFLQIALNRAVMAGNMGSEPRRRWLKSAG